MALFQTTETVTVDPNKDYLPELVGEGKKFKDAAALARGKMESDLMIENVLKEKRELEAELQKRMTAEEIFEKIKGLPKDSVTQEPPEQKETAPKGPTLEEINKLVDQTLTTRDKQRIQDQNAELVRNTLEDKFGADYATVAVKKARTIGLTQDDLEAMARERPKALLALLLPENKSDTLFAPKSTVNVGGKPSTGLPQTYKEWQEFRRKNPRDYFKPELARERFKQKKELGDKWDE